MSQPLKFDEIDVAIGGKSGKKVRASLIFFMDG